jgi:hypothetical protein
VAVPPGNAPVDIAINFSDPYTSPTINRPPEHDVWILIDSRLSLGLRAPDR